MDNQPLRNSGIELIGDVPWGTHFCQFYGNKQDLIDILVPYFAAGLANNEFCMWVCAEPLSEKQAEAALRRVVPDLDERLKNRQIEIIPHTDWYLIGGSFDQDRVLQGWVDKLNDAMARGYEGLRLTGNTFWLEKSDWDEFYDYEAVVNDVIGNYRMMAICTYALEKCGASEIADVVVNHQFALMKRDGEWTVIESSDYKQAREDLRLTEQRHTALFNSMNEAFALHEIICDGDGKPCDYRFLEVNPAFEAQTGLKASDVVGHTVREVIPDLEPAWIDSYGSVALTGKSIEFQDYSAALDRYYDVRSFSPSPGQFAAVFTDVTERKRAEESLEEANEELEATNEELRVATDELSIEIEHRRQAEEALRQSEERVRARLDVILTPQGDIGALELADIIDAPAVQSLMNSFYEISHIPMAIIDLKGTVLVGVGWQDICVNFHRVHPEACKSCIESDTQLTTGVPAGESKLYKCKNNMWDIATPIIVGGQHVGNLFSGQFLFDDESADYAFFALQAKRYGFDEKEYLAALDRVPRISRSYLDDGMAFFTKLADMLSKLSYSNVKLARSVAERDALTQSLQNAAERLNRSQEIAHLGSWELDLLDDSLYWSDEVYRIFGLQPRQFGATYEAFLEAVHPDDREAVNVAYSSSVREGRDNYEIEHRVIRHSDGDIRFVHERCEHFRNESGQIVRSVGMVHDITERRVAQMAIETANEEMSAVNEELRSTNDELHAITEDLNLEIESRKAREAELDRLNRTYRAHSKSDQAMMRATEESEYLQEVCKVIVEDCGHAMVWIGYALDDETKTVRPVASSGFDKGYLDMLQVTWADSERGRGPTGTAIRTGKPSLCRNMLTDPKFEPWRQEAIKRGYASSVVLPLISEGRAFGAVSIYSHDPDAFTEDETRLLTELADDLAYGIAMIRLRAAHEQAESALRESEERYRTLFTNMSEGFALCEIIVDDAGKPCDFRYLEANDAFQSHTGLDVKHSMGKTVREILPEIEDFWIETYGEVALTGEPARFDNQVAELDKHFEVIAFSPSRGRFAAVFMDVTERVRAQRGLAEARAEAERRAAELESFVHGMADGVVLFDTEPSIVMANDAFKKILGVPNGVTAEVWRKSYTLHTLDGEPLPLEQWPLHRTLNGEEIVHERFRVITPWRQSVTSMNASPVRGAEGKIVGGTMAFRDVTDLVELERKDAEMHEREHRIADILQKALIPEVSYTIPGCDIAVRYEPALKEAEVGGDFYDIFDLGDGKIGVLIGDVAGKGLAAAIRVAAARHSIRSYAFLDPRPSRVMSLANDALCRDETEELSMLTAFFAILDTRVGVITCANGGHESPLIVTAGGVVEEIQIPGRALGAMAGWSYPEETRLLNPGDVLVMVTDGITEARPSPLELFGLDGLKKCLQQIKGSSVEKIAAGILKTAKKHAGGKLTDDAAIIALGVKKDMGSKKRK